MLILAGYCSVGEEAAETNLRTCFEQALSETKSASGADQIVVNAVGLTLSGVDRPKDFALIEKWMSAMSFYSPELKLAIHNDAVGRYMLADPGHICHVQKQRRRHKRDCLCLQSVCRPISDRP